MATVKKVTTKRTVRNAKGRKKSVKEAARTVSKKKPSKRTKPVSVRKRTKPAVQVPAVKIDIKELDPIRKCGPGTSVQVLLKVIERIDGKSTNHLVFFDKYGWYCDHGATCPAVGYAKKQKGRLVKAANR